MDSMGAQSNDGSRLTNRAAGSSLSLYLSLCEGSYLPQFDPRGVYDLPVQSAFFRRFLRGPREIYLVARTLLLLYTMHASRGVPSDSSITGSELHPGSLRTGPTVYREGRRGKEGGREVPRGYPSDTLSAEVAMHRGGLKQISRRYSQSMLPSTEFDCGNASLYKSEPVCSFNKRTYVYRRLDTTCN